MVFVLQKGEWIKAQVVMAAGTTARLKNDLRGINTWFHLDEVRMEKPTER
jgi:hypothetical protein